MTTKHHMTMIDEAELRLKDVHMPAYYLNYQHNILKNVQKTFEYAAKARKLGLDVSDGVEPKIAYDLADRVEKCIISILQIDCVFYFCGQPKRRQHLQSLKR